MDNFSLGSVGLSTCAKNHKFALFNKSDPNVKAHLKARFDRAAFSPWSEDYLVSH